MAKENKNILKTKETKSKTIASYRNAIFIRLINLQQQKNREKKTKSIEPSVVRVCSIGFAFFV